jgi:molecular chaperone GrpE
VNSQLSSGPDKKAEALKTEGPLDFVEQFRSQIDELSREKEQIEKKAAEYLDKLKRLQADMENLQKITNRQIETVTKQASENLLVKLLPIVDALQQAGKVTHSNDALSSEEISVGLKMLLNQLMDVLKTEGLEEIPAVGQPLDPERHEVVSYIETDNVPENTVVEEVRGGYALKGRVIRPSLVIVSKGKMSKDQELEKTQAD